MDPKVQLDWIIGTQSLEKTDKQRLETLRSNVLILQKRHEEIAREKESKILTLEIQLVNTTAEKFQQAETVKRLEEENTTLKQDKIKLKEVVVNMKNDNTRLAFSDELVGQSAVVIERLEKKIHALDDTVASIEKKLSSARRAIAHHKEKAEPALRQKRRIAMKLLACVMELDDYVAVPGKQRPAFSFPGLGRSSNLSLEKHGNFAFHPCLFKIVPKEIYGAILRRLWWRKTWKLFLLNQILLLRDRRAVRIILPRSLKMLALF